MFIILLVLLIVIYGLSLIYIPKLFAFILSVINKYPNGQYIKHKITVKGLLEEILYYLSFIVIMAFNVSLLHYLNEVILNIKSKYRFTEEFHQMEYKSIDNIVVDYAEKIVTMEGYGKSLAILILAFGVIKIVWEIGTYISSLYKTGFVTDYFRYYINKSLAKNLTAMTNNDKKHIHNFMYNNLKNFGYMNLSLLDYQLYEKVRNISEEEFSTIFYNVEDNFQTLIQYIQILHYLDKSKKFRLYAPYSREEIFSVQKQTRFIIKDLLK